MQYDVFVSHASEDKESVARPLTLLLQEAGLRVWLDAFEISVGDSLRRTIDAGLAQSRFGVVIVSAAFLRKEWPNKELDGLVARERKAEKAPSAARWDRSSRPPYSRRWPHRLARGSRRTRSETATTEAAA